MNRIDELKERYHKAMHGMQAGVAMKLARGTSSDTSSKHLRVGVNAAMVDSSALAGLLMKKGLFSEEEYLEALAEGAEREHKAYEDELSQETGVRVRLV